MINDNNEKVNKGGEEEEKGSEKIKSKKEWKEGRVGVLWTH